KLEASFPNICMPSGTSATYIVRSVYTKFDDPNTEIYGSDTLRVTVAPGSLGITANTTAVGCNGQNTGTIKVEGIGGARPYQYSIDGINWQSDSTFNVPAGSYNVTIRDANLCAISQSVSVTEPPVMAGSSSTSNASCNGGNDGRITLTASGGNGGFLYSLDGQNFQASNIFNVGPGNYTATIKDNLGCVFTIPNIVVDLTNDLNFTAPADATICEGNSTQLTISSNALQYSWTPSTGLSSASVSNPTASPTSTTNYNVRLTYGRCTADVPVTVNVNPAPIPDAGADGFICYGQNYQLQGSGGMIYSWSPATYLDDATKDNPLANPDKTTTYLLSVTDANGCRSVISDAVTIDVTPPIQVSAFPSDTITYQGDQIRLLAISAATDYLWSPALGLSDPTIPDPVFTAGAVGDIMLYKVTGSTRAGCKGEAYVSIKVYKGPELYVPTGFTPNGDGRNDTFFPFPVGIKNIKYFRVFNRWGQLIYSTNTTNDGWDGKFGGQDQPNGVYVWTVEGLTQDNKVINRRGTVTLIR
ncbi:MAG TPA: gliding motility-associated C-terminal domain-containing protein, partial [Chitinophagaceae bacterium]|nr:gliding motility-associated C-terminal domain-containing protein [Chitinophagaceae bacterium]